jgi:hypothetical protein
MGVQRDSISAIHKLQESPWFDEKAIFYSIKMYLNESYSKIRIGKHLSDSFPIQNGLKQGDALSPLLFNFAL